MKLASLKTSPLHGNEEVIRDGTLVVVDKSISYFVDASHIAPNLQLAIENWNNCETALQDLYETLNIDNKVGTALQISDLASPLPRAYQWLDGSAYLSHVERVRKARGAEMPPSFLNDPLMYQGGSDHFIGPNDPIYVADEAYGIDFESEVGIITNDVPMGVVPSRAAENIKLIVLINDVSLRNLIPSELSKGFGFIHGKPPTTFSPVAITPDELGDAWLDTKVNLPLTSTYNNSLFGNPNAGDDMQFNFAELISHAAKTRPLRAGTIIGSGTVSNNDISTGCSCLVEKRVLEIIESGEAKTPFMKFGDTIHIEMLDGKKQSIFGAIDQEIRLWKN
ncbi:MAG: fumarylacetoacetate hydrolase family protein [Gammaproteobacteria bacterium]|nr:fumarylacetoacetate hydrolase family protein [Gammaproteobacteria bacterium]